MNSVIDLYCDLLSEGEDALFLIEKELSEVKDLNVIVFRPWIFAILPRTGDFKSVLLTAHTDVKNPPKKPEICDNGVICGSGADDRAGVAAIIQALKSVEGLPHGEIGILFTNDEEKGCLSAREFFQNNERSFDYVVSVDGNGRSGAGFYPQYKALGYELSFADASVYDSIKDVDEVRLSVKKGALVRVQDFYACTLTIRASDPTRLEDYFIEMKNLCGLDLEKNLSGRYFIKKRKEFGYLPKNNELLIPDFIKNAYLKEGVDFKCSYSLQGGADATVAAEYGYRSIILNSGALSAHGEDERVYADDIVLNVKVLKNILTSLR